MQAVPRRRSGGGPPKSKGGPRREAPPAAREQELERKVRRPEAEVAYLKNLQP